ncbi:porphobilinogen synthase [Alphaproteobacteria bacterium]|nr:porphobilinogen synthase [Alphaproteobacteria bacterium]
MQHKLLRLKKNEILRNMCAETNFLNDQLIQPLFITEDSVAKKIIPGIPDNYVLDVKSAIQQIKIDLKNNSRNFILFLVPSLKKNINFDLSFQTTTIKNIKGFFGDDIFLWADVCLCSITKHGHCCLYDKNKNIDLRNSLSSLSRIAVSYADAGIDGISPSDMMDGRTAIIRKSLDESNHEYIPIMSYSSKFASNFYGPFRFAANSKPTFGNRKQYQLDYRNKTDAIKASQRCCAEGADLLMVKPGLHSLDLIEPIKKKTDLMVGAYQVSGEYAGIALAAEKNLLNFNDALLESWHVMKRAGAQFIISYGARKFKELGISGK